MNIYKEFLKHNALERCFKTKDAKVFDKILKIANENFVLEHKKEKHIKIENVQYWNYFVYCPTVNFADAYAHLGMLWGIWKKESYKVKK